MFVVFVYRWYCISAFCSNKFTCFFGLKQGNYWLPLLSQTENYRLFNIEITKNAVCEYCIMCRHDGSGNMQIDMCLNMEAVE